MKNHKKSAAILLTDTLTETRGGIMPGGCYRPHPLPGKQKLPPLWKCPFPGKLQLA